MLPPGGARNAVDCALWDLDAQRAGKDVWRLAGLESVKPLVTTFTMGADDPSVMADGARKFAKARALKMKLTGDLDLDIARVKAVRDARPNTWLGVDANQGYDIQKLDELMGTLVDCDVSLLEQPIRRGSESDLDGYTSPIRIAADESALSLADVPGLVGRFNVLNIKLDKCGGLTEALAMAHEARRLGLDVMVGNMVGTSLAMAPAFVLGQLCDIVDLDGPVFLQGRSQAEPYLRRRHRLVRPRSVGMAGARQRRLIHPGMTPTRNWFGQPRGLTILFLTEMWEKFSYYGMRALLVYYMTKQLLIGQGKSSLIYGAYTALAYFTPIIGGVIADRWLGKRRAVIIGGSIMAAGHFMMAFEPLFYAALATIALGNGLFLPSLPSQINDLYKPDDPRRAGPITSIMSASTSAGFSRRWCAGRSGNSTAGTGASARPASAWWPA